MIVLLGYLVMYVIAVVLIGRMFISNVSRVVGRPVAADGGDLAFALIFGFFWPISLPVAFIMSGAAFRLLKRLTGVSKPPSALMRLVFGGNQ